MVFSFSNISRSLAEESILFLTPDSLVRRPRKGAPHIAPPRKRCCKADKKVPLSWGTFLLRFFYIFLLTEAVHHLALFSLWSKRAQMVLQDVGGKKKGALVERLIFMPPLLHPSHLSSFESQQIRLVVLHRSDGIPSSLMRDPES